MRVIFRKRYSLKISAITKATPGSALTAEAGVGKGVKERGRPSQGKPKVGDSSAAAAAAAAGGGSKDDAAGFDGSDDEDINLLQGLSEAVPRK